MQRTMARISRIIQAIDRKREELAASSNRPQQMMIERLIVTLMHGVMKSRHFTEKTPLRREPSVDIGNRPRIFDKM